MSLVFPEFRDIKVSTKTFIINTNLRINIELLFDYLPITKYILIPKKRGRKKKVIVTDPNKGIPAGSIITLEFKDKIRGINLKKKAKNSNFFRNSITIVMIINEDKKINFKISSNGKFQVTGCKHDKHAENCVKYIWKYIKDNENIYTLEDNNNLSMILVPAMRNIDFSLGFHVNRQNLDMYINNETSYYSLLETSFGYTGVNIKIPIIDDISNIKLKKIIMFEDKQETISYITYGQYLETLPIIEKKKKIKKKRFNTFLVFHSGRIIMSGCEESLMEPIYYEFIEIIRKCKDIIEEKIF